MGGPGATKRGPNARQTWGESGEFRGAGLAGLPAPAALKKAHPGRARDYARDPGSIELDRAATGSHTMSMPLEVGSESTYVLVPWHCSLLEHVLGVN